MLMIISLDFSYRENVSHDGMSNKKKTHRMACCHTDTGRTRCRNQLDL